MSDLQRPVLPTLFRDCLCHQSCVLVRSLGPRDPNTRVDRERFTNGCYPGGCGEGGEPSCLHLHQLWFPPHRLGLQGWGTLPPTLTVSPDTLSLMVAFILCGLMSKTHSSGSRSFSLLLNQGNEHPGSKEKRFISAPSFSPCSAGFKTGIAG